jgi:hypothetical protein
MEVTEGENYITKSSICTFRQIVLEDVMGGACSMDVRNEKLMHIRLKT